MKKLCIFLTAVLVVLGMIGPLTVHGETDATPEIKSDIALLLNIDTDAVVYEKNANAPADPSSLTKVVTAVLAMEKCPDLDMQVTAQEEAIVALRDILGANAGIKVGETMTMRQLLLCMMAQSANEAANVIAQELGGTMEQFVDMMNAFVSGIGCTGTKFINAHGISVEGQTTTAHDMALIGKYAMKVPGFMDLANATTAEALTIPETNINKERRLIQTNKMLLKSTEYYYKYASGIKTGSSGPDANCVMTTAMKDGYTYLCIILNAPTEVSEDGKKKTNLAMTEAKALFQWAFQNLKYKTIVHQASAVDELPVEFSWNVDHVQLVPEKDISALVPADLEASGVLIVPDKNTLPELIQAPAAKGDVVGTATIMVAGDSIGKVNLVLAEDIERSNVLYILWQLKNVFTSTAFKIVILLVVVLIVAYIVLSVLYNRKRKRLRLATPPRSYRGTGEHKYDDPRVRSRYENTGARSRYENRSAHDRHERYDDRD